MHGKLDPDEDVMSDELISQRKSTALMKALHDNIKDTIAELGWDCYDDVVVQVGGTSVYEIDGAGTKWAPVKGTRNITRMHSLLLRIEVGNLLLHPKHQYMTVNK